MEPSKTTKQAQGKAGLKSLEARKVIAILGASVAVYLVGWLFFYAILNWDTKPGSVRYVAPLPPVEEIIPPMASENTKPYADEEEILPVSEPTPAEIVSGPSPVALKTPVPAGKTPPGVRMGDGIQFVKCWNKEGLQKKDEECSGVRELLAFISDRIYILNQCKTQLVGERLLGRLDVGIEFDFDRESLSFWNNPSSTLRGSSEVVGCTQQAVAEISLDGLEPLFTRYQYRFSVWFEGKRRRIAAPQIDAKSTHAAATADPRKTVDFPTGRFDDGRFVLVTRDRVRIREKPVDGHMLGKISTGSRVLLLEQQEDWCRVRTRRGNVGWMVCWALDLR